MSKQQGSKEVPLSLFISYAHEDEPLLQQLEVHLSLLRRQGLVASWHDRQIVPGTKWAEEIDTHLEAAQLVLLLISPDFLASDYCYEIELRRALERDKQGKARIIPLILRPCDWKKAPFAHLQCLPHNAKPVTRWANRDEAFEDIIKGIRTVLEDLPGAPSQQQTRPLSPLSRTHRERMLKRVRDFWIKGVFEQSLYQMMLITLGLHERPEAVENPWHFVMQETNRPGYPLPDGTHITEVYDEADGQLLILGEPGAGKTMLLLELARDLLARAEHDENHPIPVVFNLSSWAVKQQPLDSWLVEELHTKYWIPGKVGQSWIDTDQVVLLLDGLDEVAEVHRAACVKAINAYQQKHNLVPVVACSRRAEYLAQETRVTLHRAVLVQPLTIQQIDSYLSSAGSKLEAVRKALDTDSGLQEMVQTPLMLNVVVLAYQGEVIETLATEDSIEARRQLVFAAYVRRMLQRRSLKKCYPPQQTLRWLAWLAREMVKWKQTEFSMEWKPAWLPERILRLYRSLAAGLLSGLAFGLLVGFFTMVSTGVLVGVLVGLFAGVFGTRLIVRIILFGMFIGLTFVFLVGQPFGALVGGFIGLTFGLPIWLIATIHLVDDALESYRSIYYESFAGFRSGVLKGLEFGVFVGAVIGLFFGVLIGLLVGWHSGLLIGLHSGLLIGLRSGLIFGLIVGLFTSGLVEQVALRLLLWHTGLFPWKPLRFLDYATERILLRKVGGSYIFIHRLLLDYFASLETSSSLEASAGSAPLQKLDEKA